MYAGRTNSIVKTGGTTPTPTQTKEVKATSFPTVVSPDSGYALSQATVTAPDNLVAENIKSGVSIAGVTGTYEGSGGSGGLDDRTKFWMRAIQNRGVRFDSEHHLIPFVMLKEYWPDPLPPSDWDYSGMEKRSFLTMTPYCCARMDIDIVELPEGRGTDGLTSIPDFAFYYLHAGKTGYATVTGGASEVYSFGGSAFAYSYLTGIPNVNYYQNTLSASMFSTANLETCNVPEGITKLENAALENLTIKDNTITLPSTLTTVNGYGTIGGTYSRHAKIIMKATTPPTLVHSSGIQKNYVDQIVVPAGTLEAYHTATNWSALADIMVEATADAGTTEGGA